MGLGISGLASALAVSGTDLYVGGIFSGATNSDGGSITVNSIAKWDGSAWSALGSGVSGMISYTHFASAARALAVSGDTLYAGGTFTSAGDLPAMNLAKWDGSAWSTFGSGMDAPVHALTMDGSNFYVGGEFISVGGVWANGIAKWDGSTWSALGAGIGRDTWWRVSALAVSGTTLYAGGSFTRATNSGGGTVTVNNIARWNGSTWSALGSGLNGDVYALAVSGNTLYVGGEFTWATNGVGGRVAVNHIARWNGSSWSAMGTGTDGRVYALAVSGTTLYAGGYFYTAGGLPASAIARWNGSTWSALGTGIGGEVYALAASETDLYAGGYFTTAGGLPAGRIAKWNGSSWSALGSGMMQDVLALAVSRTNLYAGGEFTTGGSVFANRIAKWDGSNWSALGSGLTDGRVAALAADEAGHLFVGGAFMLAGGKASPYLAQANLTPQPMVIEGIRVDAGVVTLDCRVAAGAVCAVQRATEVRFTQDLTTLHTTNAPPDGRFTCTDATPPATTAFYRLVQP